MTHLQIDREFTTEVCRELVAIDSVNPAFPADTKGRPGRGEAAIAVYAADLLRGLGLETHVHEATSGRPSVVGILRGTGGGRSLMLNGHVDTVGPGAMAKPFEPRIEGGRLYGRGAYDMKGPVAACIGAVDALAKAEVRAAGDVVLALVADEENESLGTQEVLRHHVTDGAIVAEPTDMQLCLAHKGFVWLAVTTHGVAYHGSDYRRGVDANLRLVRALAPLADLQERLLEGESHPLLGPASLHLGVLSGGTAPSIYASRSRAKIEVRTLPGGASTRVLGAIEGVIEAARKKLPANAIEFEELLARPPFEAQSESELASLLGAEATEVQGAAPEIVGVPFWTDAAFVRECGVDTVLFGPSGAGAHADEEWVDLESVCDSAAIFARLALAYCGG